MDNLGYIIGIGIKGEPKRISSSLETCLSGSEQPGRNGEDVGSNPNKFIT